MAVRFRKKESTRKRRRRPVALSIRKKIVFSCIALVLFCGLLASLEWGLRLAGYGRDVRLFVTAEAEVDCFLACNREIARQYLPYLANVPQPPWDVFLKEKPVKGIRMFVLGGSTAAGFPYGNNLMFSRILGILLQDAFPDRKIEIVSTAMSATNTYTQLDFMDEILAQQPDAILIYSGHNEYYGALGVASRRSPGRSPTFARAYLRLHRLKLFALMQGAVDLVKGSAERGQGESPDFDPSATLMERMVGVDRIALDGALYRRGWQQFAGNLDRICRKAHRAGVPVLVSELVSNVRDQRPFVSVETTSAPSAQEVFEKAQSLDRQGFYEEAKRLYVRAKDLDALRFRAPEEFNDIIHEIAERYHAPVVPMRRYFETASPDGIVGDHLMLDHLHPNIDGYFLMAEAFSDTLRETDVVNLPWQSAGVRPIEYYKRNWGVTDLDVACADLSIRYLKGGWPFRRKAGPNRTLQSFHPQNEIDALALRVLTEEDVSIITGHFQLAESYEKKGDYLSAYEEYRALYHTIPWSTVFLNGAAKSLLRLKRLDEVPSLLARSLEIRDTFFAQRWLGHLLVNQRRFTEAIPYLEKARVGHEDDRQVLMCLEKAYQYTGRRNEALAIRRRLDRLSMETDSLRTGR